MKIMALILVIIVATGFVSLKKSSITIEESLRPATLSHLWSQIKSHFGMKSRQIEPSLNLNKKTSIDLAVFGKSLMHEILLTSKDSLKECYLNFLRTEPQGTKEGYITAVWTIDGTGAVKDLKLKDNEIQSDGFKQCVSDELLKVSQLKPTPTGEGFQFQQKFKFKRDIVSDMNFEVTK